MIFISWKNHTAKNLEEMNVSVTIVSDSLFSHPELLENDQSGTIAVETLTDMGIGRCNLDYLPDDLSGLKAKIEQEASKKTHLIVLIGGTGVSKRDVTYEAIKSVIDKEILGFGEEFRRLSIQKIGSYGMLSRAIAGTLNKSLVIGLPGSPDATQTGVRLACSILGHVIQQLEKDN